MEIYQHAGPLSLPAVSFEQLSPDVHRAMKDRADHDVIGFDRVEDQMRLKSEAPQPRCKLMDCGTDLRKVGDQAECPFQAFA